jgi:hypothetical protein
MAAAPITTAAGPASAAQQPAIAAAEAGPRSLADAVWAAQHIGLAGCELAAVREAGLVVYGLCEGVVAAEAGFFPSRVKKRA